MYRNLAPTGMLFVPFKTPNSLYIKQEDDLVTFCFILSTEVYFTIGASELCLKPCGFTGVFRAGSCGFGSVYSHVVLPVSFCRKFSLA